MKQTVAELLEHGWSDDEVYYYASNALDMPSDKVRNICEPPMPVARAEAREARDLDMSRYPRLKLNTTPNSMVRTHTFQLDPRYRDRYDIAPVTSYEVTGSDGQQYIVEEHTVETVVEEVVEEFYEEY